MTCAGTIQTRCTCAKNNTKTYAVDRVQMRRRCREAYRLSRHLLPSPCPGIDIAFIYVADTVTPYPKTLRAMTKMLSSITQAVSPDENAC